MSDTALGAAEMRAEESLRPNRLFDDPYAAAFVAAAPPLFPDIPALADDAELAALVEAGVTGVAVRTRFFDDFVEAACTAGCRQVVLLAAGLDTRAFRLDWPDGMQLFELDLPELFAFKERVLAERGAQPRCERRIVPVDLREGWPTRLGAAGFDATRVSAWVAEGLLVYLSNDDAARLLVSVHDHCAPTSRLSFDHDLPTQQSTLQRATEMDGMAAVAAMWHGGLSEEPDRWLREHGWTAESVARETFARTCDRTVDPTGAFFTATRM